MAKKSVEGQLDLFELFSSVEELEESVKGVPEPEDELEVEAEPEETVELKPETGDAAKSDVTSVEQRIQAEGTPVMQRSFRNVETEESAVVAYLNYNMVYLKDWQGEPIIYSFDSSKDAVDFYVGQMERLSGNKKVEIQKEQCPLEQAVVQKWTGEVEV